MKWRVATWLLTLTCAAAQAQNPEALIEVRPALLISLLNANCPLHVSNGITIDEVFSLSPHSDAYDADCIVEAAATGKKEVRRLKFQTDGGRLLLDNTQVADLSALSVDVGGSTKKFAAKIAGNKDSFFIAVSASGSPSVDLSQTPKLLTRSAADAPSGFAAAITPAFCSALGGVAAGTEIKDTSGTVKLKGVSLSISGGQTVFRFGIDAGAQVKSGLTVNAELKPGQNNTAMIKALTLDVTAPPTQLPVQDQLKDQVGVAMARALAAKASKQLAGKPFIAAGHKQSLPYGMSNSKGLLEIISDNGRIFTTLHGFSTGVFVYEGYCRITK